jgi:hypothetical protein
LNEASNIATASPLARAIVRLSSYRRCASGMLFCQYARLPAAPAALPRSIVGPAAAGSDNRSASH